MTGCSRTETPAASASAPSPVKPVEPPRQPAVGAVEVASSPVPPVSVPAPAAPKPAEVLPRPAVPPAVTEPVKSAGVPAAGAPGEDLTALVKKRAFDALDQLTKSGGDQALASAASPGKSQGLTSGLSTLSALSNDQIAGGLKAALAMGLQNAVSTLGRSGGFLTNAQVRIPMPDQLKTVEATLRTMGQNKMADEFVTTMNRAAEQAVPAAASVFANSLGQMTVADARGILTGPTNSATEYFRRTAGSALKEKFKPIVAEATARTGATAAYKKFMGKTSFASPLLASGSLDLDTYVTDKALDGLFLVVGEEEVRIRRNPAARTTDLLKLVFGSVSR